MTRHPHGRFTLVELLVVVAIIAVLAALLLPSLREARLKARDLHCMSTQRQTLMAVFTYNGDFERGLQNYHPRCTSWGKGWGIPIGSVVHSPYGNDYADTLPLPSGPQTWNVVNPPQGGGATQGVSHYGSEACSMDNWWRGYLLTGKYAKADTLGCPVTYYKPGANPDYFRAQHYLGDRWGQAINQVEYSRTADTCRRYQAFVWWGPGTRAAQAVYQQGLQMRTTGFTNALGNPDADGCSLWTGKRGPLFSCGRTSLTEYWNSYYWWDASKHRPKRFFVKTGIGVTNIYCYGYAENVGYTDGSVRWFMRPGLGTYDPFSP